VRSFFQGTALAPQSFSGEGSPGKERIMTSKPNQPSDDVWSAPESGTIRDDTSGNAPSDRGHNPGQGAAENGNAPHKDDPSIASEER
jgi:hypothetical protein